MKLEIPDDRIYYNVNINNNNIDSNLAMACQFNENLVQPLVSNPSLYYLALVRWQIPGLSLPIFVCPIQTGQNQTDPLLTPFAVTLNYNGQDFVQFVQFVSNTTKSNPPAPGSNAKYLQTQDEFYYIYSVNQFLSMVNNALAEAFLALITADPSAPVTETPYFTYDSTTELISLTTQKAFVSNSDSPVLIYVNTALHKYFDAFEYVYDEVNNNEKDYQFVIRETENNGYTIPGQTINNPQDYIRQPQDYPCMYNWIGMQGIMITTNQVPVKAEYVPAPVNSENSANQNMGTRKIITDFQPNFTILADARSVFQFAQSGPYRCINLTATTPLTTFDIYVYWQDRFNNLYPVNIPPGWSASFKFAFIKKDNFYS